MPDPQKKYGRIQTRFLFGLAAILVMFAALVATTIYFYQSKALEDNAYRKANLIMTSMEASRAYVREVLRPRMYEVVGDDFVIEAMSSSYISRAIAERVEASNSDMVYRRVSVNARNKSYEANQLERQMVDYFQENPEQDEWHEIVEDSEGRETFMKFKPVVVSGSCLHCHGDPEDAPEKIIEIYGANNGFYRSVGEVIGVVSVALPVDINLLKIKEVAITVFMTVIPSFIFLFAIISVFFNRVISQNLKYILKVFRKSLHDERGRQLLEESQSLDEIEELNEAAVTIAEHLQKNRSTLERYAHQLYQSKELLQSVFDGISDPVVLLSRAGTLKIVNKAFLQSYGLDLEMSIDSNIYDLPTSHICPIVICRDVFENIGDAPVSREVTLATGEIYQLFFYPVTDEQSKTSNIVCYMKDITEEKQLELKIQHTEKIVSMGQVAAGVAHEINNPLGVILCHIDFVRDDENLSEESKSDLAIIEKHVGNCKRIIADLLRFSRPTSESKEEYSLNDLVGEVVGMVIGQFDTKKIDITTELAPNIPSISMDVDRFKQVVLNLLLNSGHAIVENGHIVLRTYLGMGEECIVLEVEDDGGGIHPDLEEKIFEPFFTTKEPGEGTGLGLSVSYGIISNHGGTIQLERRDNDQTCFVIRIPMEENLND